MKAAAAYKIASAKNQAARMRMAKTSVAKARIKRMTALERAALPDKAFAVIRTKMVNGKTVKVRLYPMHTEGHASLAIPYADMWATNAERLSVRQMAKRLYPERFKGLNVNAPRSNVALAFRKKMKLL